MSSVRALVVEDYEPFRRLICRPWGKGSACNHLRSVRRIKSGQKAKELKPDLTVLDLGLPTLNGIEAARQLRKKLPPNPK